MAKEYSFSFVLLKYCKAIQCKLKYQENTVINRNKYTKP